LGPLNALQDRDPNSVQSLIHPNQIGPFRDALILEQYYARNHGHGRDLEPHLADTDHLRQASNLDRTAETAQRTSPPKPHLWPTQPRFYPTHPSRTGTSTTTSSIRLAPARAQRVILLPTPHPRVHQAFRGRDPLRAPSPPASLPDTAGPGWDENATRTTPTAIKLSNSRVNFLPRNHREQMNDRPNTHHGAKQQRMAPRGRRRWWRPRLLTACRQTWSPSPTKTIAVFLQ
jgi:hypothetical protein